MFYAQMPSALGRILMQTDGLCLTGLYFVGQKDCPILDGLPAREAHAFDPTWGKIAGAPIKEFKAYKNEKDSSDLFKQQSALDAMVSGADSSQKSAVSLAVEGQLQLMQDTPARALTLLKLTQMQLNEYFSGNRHHFDIPLGLTGTLFQKQVWNALLDIIYGTTVSYGDVARMAGLSVKHSRPVGVAVGRNPISIIIPCHRVLSGTKTLTGYSGGLQRKFALLQLEGFSVH